MNYPIISEYIEAIKSAEENFDELKHLRPVLDEDGEPMMSGGNFAVVFKMKDEQTGKLHAVKCFLREQEGRAEAYRQIAEELEYVSSTFLTPIKYMDKELFVDTGQSDETEFPVLLMDWVEGQTLDKYIREHIDDQYELSLLAYQFSRLAMWLMPQPFAHGDLKPDNILVKEDGTLVLVDYDGMYVPAMKGQKARELGSPDFRHPLRTEDDFDEHIDDFSLASILLSLKAISLIPELMEQYGASDRLLFSEKDYRDISQCELLHHLFPSDDMDLNKLYSLFLLCLVENSIPLSLNKSLSLKRPDHKTKNNIPYLLKRATHGDANSQYKLGLCYKEGEDIERNYEEAVKWFTKAANSNHAKALKELGYCYLRGVGVEKSVERALSLYEKAGLYYAKEDYCALMEHKVLALEELQKYDECISILLAYVQSGKGCKKCSLVNQYNLISRCCPWMQFKLGEFYENGRGISKNYVKGFEWYRKSAEQGYPSAYNRLGVCYAFGRGVHQDYNNAVKCFIESANYGNSVAQKNLGVSYENGDGVEKDYVKAVEWYKKSAEQGNFVAQRLLGKCYYVGKGVEQDYAKAVEWYTKSAEQGDSEGQWLLGFCFFSGTGVEKNYTNAFEWYTKSAEQGDSEGQRRLGDCYFYGNGVKQDYSVAYEWYKKSAEQRNSVAQRQLGKCYHVGKGVEQDYAKAVEWYTKSAEQGDSEGQFLLGLCYKNGQGVEQDYAKAVEWYTKSAEQGDSSAQWCLGQCYEYGEGVEQDYAKAVEWYTKSGEQGEINKKQAIVTKSEKDNLLPENKASDQNVGWMVKDTRPFDPDEIAAVKKAVVVASLYGKSVCFFMKSGGQTYIPLSQNSSLTVGDVLNIKTAKIITLSREGDNDIYRVIE